MKDNKGKELVKNVPTIDSKYIQQHLANERTFLAWLRTGIAIMGIGFLITNLHFTMKLNLSPTRDILANIIGLSSVGLGILTIIMATYDYLKKINTINQQTFRAPKTIIVTLSTFVIVIALIFAIYFFIL
ncbi:YidH family protein [Rummeliibacillus sp. JY-2-4R]